MNNKIILGLVGPIASGKEVTKNYILSKYNSSNCKFSTILRDILNRIDVLVSRENLQTISTILRQNFGEELLARVIARDASILEGDIVVIDGVRRPADIKYLRELPNFYLIKIDANPNKRHKRAVLRNENKGDDEKTFEEFLKDHESEADSLVPIVMEQSDYEIDNNGSLDDLYKQIDEIIERIKNI